MLTLKQVIQATPVQIKGRAQNQCYGQLIETPKKKEKEEEPEEEPEPEPEPEPEIAEQELDDEGNPVPAKKPVKVKPKKVVKKKPPPLPAGMLEDANGKYREFTYRVKCTDGWRKTILRVYGSVSISGRCWMWCDCPYFKYHCEVALAHRGSSSVISSNGQRPRFTNPDMSPRCCKHCYMAIVLAMGKKKNSG